MFSARFWTFVIKRGFKGNEKKALKQEPKPTLKHLLKTTLQLFNYDVNQLLSRKILEQI
jgi:hypothetical protein